MEFVLIGVFVVCLRNVAVRSEATLAKGDMDEVKLLNKELSHAQQKEIETI